MGGMGELERLLRWFLKGGLPDEPVVLKSLRKWPLGSVEQRTCSEDAERIKEDQGRVTAVMSWCRS